MTDANTQQLAATLRAEAERLRATIMGIEASAQSLEGLADQLPGNASPLGNYSQRDPLWRNEVFAGGMRFETDGCYVCAVSDIVALVGCTDSPPVVAMRLREAQCFYGANLSYPERIPDAYSLLRYNGTHQWHHGPADMDLVWSELEGGPVIAEVDFQWRTQKQNQHFVVLVRPTVDRRDIWIHDSWDGSVVRLMQKYAAEHWDLSRTIYGLRLLRVGGD